MFLLDKSLLNLNLLNIEFSSMYEKLEAPRSLFTRILHRTPHGYLEVDMVMQKWHMGENDASEEIVDLLVAEKDR